MDPQSVFRSKQLEQSQSQFDQRMAADQAYRSQQLGLQRQQEARLSRPQAQQDDEFARYQAMTPEQRDLYDRYKGRKTEGGTASAANPTGLNERQQSGLSMQTDAALSYAANLIGVSRQEVEKLYQSEGPEGVEKAMLAKGKRPLQGGMARVLQSIPLGKTIVEAKNADLLPQGKAGGAGIALMQNPSGPITTPDFQAGEAQFPNPSYPLPNQAEMVRGILEQSQRARGGAPAAPAADPLAAHAGKVIKQNGKRYQVIQGSDGKFMAVPLK
jgi:hypothetical protein